MIDSEVLKKYENAIYKAAHKYYTKNPRFSFQDLVAQSRLVTIQANRNFNSEKGASFHTYLTWSLHNELAKYVNGNMYDLNVSEWSVRKEYKEKGDTDCFRHSYIAERLDNNSGNFEEDLDFNDVLPSGEATPEEIMEKKENLTILRQEINSLPDKEREIITMRRLNGATLQECADVMGTSLQNIHQHEKKAFDRLCRSVKNKIG